MSYPVPGKLDPGKGGMSRIGESVRVRGSKTCPSSHDPAGQIGAGNQMPMLRGMAQACIHTHSQTKERISDEGHAARMLRDGASTSGPCNESMGKWQMARAKTRTAAHPPPPQVPRATKQEHTNQRMLLLPHSAEQAHTRPSSSAKNARRQPHSNRDPTLMLATNERLAGHHKAAIQPCP